MLHNVIASVQCGAAHPNRRSFCGMLAPLDTASDKAPSGARGHKVLITRRAAEDALPSLMGMALDCSSALDRHDARRKVGVITHAVIVNEQIEVSGFLYARDFPEIVAELEEYGGKYGCSYEVCDALVEDIEARVWVLTRVTFTGAAILRKTKAAYRSTSIELA